MNHFLGLLTCFVVAVIFVTQQANVSDMPPKDEQPSLAPFEFHRIAAASPEAAARTLFRGLAMESPKHFVQHLLIGVCDNSIDTLQKFAESLHRTKFIHGGDAFTFYDLRDQRRGLNGKKPIRVVAMAPFDEKDKQVMALESQRISTYYAERFSGVDVVGQGYDGLKYRTRIVVAQVDGGWYAIPRSRSAQAFYKIADAMLLEPYKSDTPNE